MYVIDVETRPVNNGIILEEIVGEHRQWMQHELGRLTCCNDSPRFPGPSPVSIERADFPQLKVLTYYASEKTDGWRAVLMLTRYDNENIACVFDRKLTPYLISLENTPVALWQGSVFDGEIVRNKQERTWYFLCFDALRVSSIPIYLRPFSERMRIARLAWASYTSSIQDSMTIRIKVFLPPEDIGALPAHMARVNEEFDVDGVVFMPDDMPIVYGRHRELFKLKTKHSIDFMVDTDGKGLRIYDASARTHVRVGEVAPGTSGISPGDIVECVCVNKQKYQVVMVRRDKNEANDMLTYKKTLLNMNENIQLHEVQKQLMM